MKFPYEAITLRKKLEDEKCIHDCVEERITFDLAVVEYFTETTFDNKNFDKGTTVEMDRYGFNITTPYDVFKKAMKEKNLI